MTGPDTDPVTAPPDTISGHVSRDAAGADHEPRPDLAGLSAALWAYRTSLSTAGWFPPGGQGLRERRAARRRRLAWLSADIELARAASTLGLPDGTDLPTLATHVPPVWSTLFTEHHQAITALEHQSMPLERESSYGQSPPETRAEKKATISQTRNPQSFQPHTLWGWLTRPVLVLRLRYFRSLVEDSVYLPPVANTISPVTADRVALIGSTNAVRVGVTDDDLTTLSRTAAEVSAQRGRPFTWIYTGTPVLTAKEAASHFAQVVADADACVFVLGFSDTLLMTTPDIWEKDLADLITAVRFCAGDTCGIALTGLAPMENFRYTARLGRRGISRQVARLNTATARLAEQTPGCVYVAPPVFDMVAGKPGEEEYSWALIHRLWGHAISHALLTLLDPSRHTQHQS